MWQLAQKIFSDLLTKTNNNSYYKKLKTPLILGALPILLTASAYNVDWSFIRSLEGFETKGYVPSEAQEKKNKVVSGVTIGTGFDLGQHRDKDLISFNIPLGIRSKLIPYVGLKGADARKALKEKPLVLTKDEAEFIDTKVKMAKIKQLVSDFERSSNTSFLSLTKAQQTVIMSVYFQYGNLAKRAPNFWKHVTNLDWDATIKELENFGDSYKKRRLKEANYLKQGLYTS